MRCPSNSWHTPMIEIKEISKIYAQKTQPVTALKGINLVLEEGKFIALVGPSGCGKSTLINLLGGLDVPTSGKILMGQKQTPCLSDEEWTALRRKEIGIVFQFFHLLPTLSALENVSLPLSLQGLPHKEIRSRAIQSLASVGLSDRLHHRPSELSGGEMQRTALARALVIQPRLLLADEPTGNLDSKIGSEILHLLREAVDNLGCTLLMATHSKEATSLADQVVYLQDGEVEDVSKLKTPSI